MSRKDYEKFAAMFKWELESTLNEDIRVVRNLILSSADIFEQENPRFDREKFYVASGLTKYGDL